MVEVSIIQQTGFHNLVDKDNNVWGFQFAMTTQMYKGIFLSQFRTGRAFVDGVVYPKESLIWNIHGYDYTAEEMYDMAETPWTVNEPAYVKIKKPGGLSVGYHDVAIEWGYINVYGRGPEKEFDGSGLGNAGGSITPRRILLVW
jgi:hypothetical protein